MSTKTSVSKVKFTLRRSAVAITLALGAGSVGAVGIQNVTVTGNDIGYWKIDPPGSCSVVEDTTPPTDAALTAIVQGGNQACNGAITDGPGGYVELGNVPTTVWTGGARSLEGDFGLGTPVVKLESLTLADWSAGAFPNRLVDRYISDAIAANCNGVRPENFVLPGPVNLLEALSTCFLTGTAIACNGTAIEPPPAERSSDPDVAYVNYANLSFSVGLAGIDNANDIGQVGALPLVCPDPDEPNPLDWDPVDPLRLSEVAKFSSSFDGGDTFSDPQYLYGFTPVASGITGLLPWYDAIYEVEANQPKNGSVFYTLDLTSWTSGNGIMADLVAGFFDAGPQEDLAGLTQDGQVFYSLDQAGNWVLIPGSLETLMVANLDGTGTDDLVGLNSDGVVFYTTDLTTWQSLSTGSLASVVAADLNGDNVDELAGLSASGQTWYTLNPTALTPVWQQVGGQLAQLIAADVNGDGNDDLVGLNGDGFIFVSTDLITWTNVPGQLVQVQAGPLDAGPAADLIGVNAVGQIWFTLDLANWTQQSGILSSIIVPDLTGNGLADPTGINPDGDIYYFDETTQDWVFTNGVGTLLIGADLDGNNEDDLVAINSNQ